MLAINLGKLTLALLLAASPPATTAQAQQTDSSKKRAAASGTRVANKDYERALELEKQDKVELAVRALEESIQLDPDRLDAYLALDRILSRQGKWDTIISHWTRYLESHPDDARAYCERSGAYLHLRDLPNVLKDGEKACSLGFQECCENVAKFRGLFPNGLPQASKPLAPSLDSEEGRSGAEKLEIIAFKILFAAFVLLIPALIIIWIVSAVRARRAEVLPKAPEPAWTLPRELAGSTPRRLRFRPLRAVKPIPYLTVIYSLPFLILPLWWENRVGPVNLWGLHFVDLLEIFLGLGAALAIGTVLRAAFVAQKLLKYGKVTNAAIEIQPQATASTGFFYYRYNPSAEVVDSIVAIVNARIFYTFSPQGGRTIRGKYRPLRLFANPQAEFRSATGTVVYNPDDPSRNILYPSQLYRVVSDS